MTYRPAGFYFDFVHLSQQAEIDALKRFLNRERELVLDLRKQLASAEAEIENLELQLK